MNKVNHKILQIVTNLGRQIHINFNFKMVWYCMQVWYGMVLYGMVLYGMVLYGMVLYGMVWYGMVWYGMVWYGMVWYGMVWYGMVWYGMVWYGMVWNNYTVFYGSMVIRHLRGNNFKLP